MARRSKSRRSVSPEDIARTAFPTRFSPPAGTDTALHPTWDGYSGRLGFVEDLVVGPFHITFEHRQGLRFIRLEDISPFDDTFQKIFHQVRILRDALSQYHHARVRILDTELIEIDQFPEAGFAGNEQVGYRHRSGVDYAPFQRLQAEIRFAGW